jgi:hypothetical protein
MMQEGAQVAIANWGDHYENSRTESIKCLQWVPFPNKHDGESFSELITMKNGPEHFDAFILIVQVASKCDPRGTLVRKDGSPHTPRSLALKTRAPEKLFAEAIPVLASGAIGWLTIEGGEAASVDENTPHRPVRAVKPVRVCQDKGKAPANFKAWTEANFAEQVKAANDDGLLAEDEAAEFVDYWMEPSPTGRARFTLEKTWDTRRRMKTALRLIFTSKRSNGNNFGGRGSDADDRKEGEWKQARDEVAKAIWRAKASTDDDAVRRALQAARDKYRDTPKHSGRDAVSAGYEMAKNNPNPERTKA